MKALFTLFIVIACGLSLNSLGSDLSLLTSEDWELEDSDRARGPVMSSLPTAQKQWESFNQWKCFSTQNAQIVRVDVNYEGQIKRIPQIDIEFSDHLFQITLGGDTNDDLDSVESDWKNLIAETKEFCVYSAFLQKLPDVTNRLTSSLWILERLKSRNGVWTNRE